VILCIALTDAPLALAHLPYPLLVASPCHSQHPSSLGLMRRWSRASSALLSIHVGCGMNASYYLT